jgi:alkane 1-monooxygenase
MQTDATLDIPQDYRDHKRYAWLLSLIVPLLTGMNPLLYYLWPDARVFWLPVLLSYGLVPLLDFLLGEDISNPPPAVVPALEADTYYRAITFAMVPLLWGAFVFGVWFFASHTLPWHAQLAGIISTGLLAGYGINLGHELGHKRGTGERWLTKLILAMTGYGHFHIEHNRGHHRDVATPYDPASSRMGEPIYRFVLREMPGAFRRAWLLEKDRLLRSGSTAWTLDNEILQGFCLTLSAWLLLTLWLGWQVLPFLLLTSFWSYFLITSANYIEHYGLLRTLQDNGRYEACQPQHSWNSNRIVSNLLLFHLQRHADHHAHPARRYQSLRHFEQAPQLPNGYFGMFLVAYIPPLWYRVMDRRLLAAVAYNPQKINFDPRKKASLIRRYGLSSKNTPASH